MCDAQARVASQRRSLQGISSAQPTADHLYFEHVYQCLASAPGVAYRCSPNFADKNSATIGPAAPAVVIATNIIQGPEAMFLQCSSGCGWLPFSDASGNRMHFKHLGKKEDLDMRHYNIFTPACSFEDDMSIASSTLDSSLLDDMSECTFVDNDEVWEDPDDAPLQQQLRDARVAKIGGQMNHARVSLESELTELNITQSTNITSVSRQRESRTRQAAVPEETQYAPSSSRAEEQVYQCLVPAPGVGYRCSPNFADKNASALGPVASAVVIAASIVQGPEALFLQCSSGCGWLPYMFSDPSGRQVLFKHLGKRSEVNMRRYQLCAPSSQVSPGSRQFKRHQIPEERDYQCLVPGVGYRFSPNFADKNSATVGPAAPAVVIAVSIVQGPEALFLQCGSGCGLLPLSDPSGRMLLFRHLGKHEELDMRRHELFSPAVPMRECREMSDGPRRTQPLSSSHRPENVTQKSRLSLQQKPARGLWDNSGGRSAFVANAKVIDQRAEVIKSRISPRRRSLGTIEEDLHIFQGRESPDIWEDPHESPSPDRDSPEIWGDPDESNNSPSPSCTLTRKGSELAFDINHLLSFPVIKPPIMDSMK